MASYDELAGCARWMQGRIPTMEEARSIYEYAEELRSKHISYVSAQTIPAVNGYGQLSFFPPQPVYPHLAHVCTYECDALTRNPQPSLKQRRRRVTAMQSLRWSAGRQGISSAKSDIPLRQPGRPQRRLPHLPSRTRDTEW